MRSYAISMPHVPDEFVNPSCLCKVRAFFYSVDNTEHDILDMRNFMPKSNIVHHSEINEHTN